MADKVLQTSRALILQVTSAWVLLLFTRSNGLPPV